MRAFWFSITLPYLYLFEKFADIGGLVDTVPTSEALFSPVSAISSYVALAGGQHSSKQRWQTDACQSVRARNIEHKTNWWRNLPGLIEYPPQIYQCGAQERLGATAGKSWDRLWGKGVFCWYLFDSGSIMDPMWAPSGFWRGSPNRPFSYQINIKLQRRVSSKTSWKTLFGDWFLMLK